jgi:hypothetical protein
VPGLLHLRHVHEGQSYGGCLKGYKCTYIRSGWAQGGWVHKEQEIEAGNVYI